MKKKRTYRFENDSLSVRRYRTARGSLLAMILVTVINTVMSATGDYETNTAAGVEQTGNSTF